MTEPVTRAPYDHTLSTINATADNLRNIERLPSGRPRDLDGPTGVGVLTVWSNLAIASALLAVADALRPSPADGQGA